MRKPNSHHHLLYRTLLILSILSLWIGQAAVPLEPTPPADPPTPVEAAYADWTAQVEPMAKAQGLSSAAAEMETLVADCSETPSKLNVAGVVYSGFSVANDWNEDIYFRRAACYTAPRVRLTSHPGSDFEPRLNIDGTAVVFVSDRNSPSNKIIYTNIYTKSSTQFEEQRLTFTSGQDRMPAFSPDGKQIVFASDRTGAVEIFKMNSNGSDPVQLTSSPELDLEPDWSPNGKKIAWVRRMSSTTGALYVMNQDGTDQQAILPSMRYLGQPVWSSSGSQIAFSFDSDNDGWTDLGIVNADGSGLRSVPTYKPWWTDLKMGGWLPDDIGLVYNEIRHTFFDDQWYIAEARVSRFKFDYTMNNTIITLDSSYSFYPHVRCIDNVPPVSTIKPLPEFSHYDHLILDWQITDNFSQPYTYAISLKLDSSQEWGLLHSESFTKQANPPFEGSAHLQGTPGETVSFRIQSLDWGDNSEPLKTTPDTWTRFYKWLVKTTMLDARAYPLSGVEVQAAGLMNQTMSGADGEATSYLANTGQYDAHYVKAGYIGPPEQKWLVDGNMDYLTVLTGPDEQVQNGHFTAQSPLASWQVGGSIEGGAATGRYGKFAARLGAVCSSLWCYHSPTALGKSSLSSPGIAMGIDADGKVYVRYQGVRFGAIDEAGAIHPWPNLPVQGAYGPIKFDPKGMPYMIAEGKVISWNGSAWTTQPAPYISAMSISYDMDAQGQMHILYRDHACGDCLKYALRKLDGTWNAPLKVSEELNAPEALAVEPGGTAHIVYGSDPLRYMQILPDGTITGQKELSWQTIESIYLKLVPGQGLYTLYNLPSNYWVLMNRSIAGQWSDRAYGIGRMMGIDADTSGNEYLLHQDQDIPKIIMIPAGGTIGGREYDLPQNIGNVSSFGIDLQGRPHYLVQTALNNDVQYYHRRGTLDAVAGTGALEQSLTLSAGMKRPTLSFFYQIDSTLPVPLSRFDVTYTPTNGQAVSLFSQAAGASEWKHAWVDLTPYLGQSGKLTFQLEQNAGEQPVSVFIDEVSVSSWPTPNPLRTDPGPLPFPIKAGTWVDLYGENLQQGAKLYYGNTQLTSVTWVDDTHVRFVSPQFPRPGLYPIKVVNPGGAEAVINIFIGKPLFLPITLR